MFKGGKMEDFVLETDVLTEFEFEAPREHNIRVVIVKTEKFLEIENEDIMGQTSLDWVKNNGCKDFEKDKVHIAKLGKNQNLLDVALPFVKEGDDYLLVLYADTPLLQSLDVNDAVEYATTKNLDYCKLPRGCVFKVKSAKANKFEMTSEANFFAKESFFAVFDYKTLSQAREVIRSRIIAQLQSKGVNILFPNSTYIDFCSQIEKGVTIFQNNVIKGHSLVKSGTVLRENNIISNSLIGENCDIIECFLCNAKLKKSTKLGPYITVTSD